VDLRVVPPKSFGAALAYSTGSDSQPDRLDLNDTACLAAKQAGVKVVISSDAHSTRNFSLLDYRVNQARRGWIEKDDILNTRPLRNLRPRR